MSDKTIIQYFEWYVPNDSKHWERTARDAAHLAELGFTDVWLPPAYKGFHGATDVGYGVYDLYDLGEFDQKGTIPTKYGTKDEYLAAIKALHAHGLRVIADIVLNHKMGGDEKESLKATKVDSNHRKHVIKEHKKIEAWTMFTFPGRNGKYSDFTWDSTHITAVDYDDITGKNMILLLEPNSFATKVSRELDNYDFLMGVDLNLGNQEVIDELTRWGKWYMDFTGIDGFRLDALKHIRYDFYPKWLWHMREYKDWNMFAMGEYWEKDIKLLKQEVYNHQNSMSMLDVPLHYRFWGLPILMDEHSTEEEKRKVWEIFPEGLSLSRILEDTLIDCNPGKAVAFVDNHDTQPTQALESWVLPWFKPLAYAIILLMKDITPCVFYGDLYGVPFSDFDGVRELEKLLYARQRYAQGDEVRYFNLDNVIGWTRGDSMAVVMSVGDDGWKEMKLGKPGQVFVDLLGNHPDEIVIDEKGNGNFLVRGKKVSVWVPKE